MVWLSQQQLAELYQSSRTNVVENIRHIYEDGELNKMATCRKFRQVQKEGNREVTREIPFYNLDIESFLKNNWKFSKFEAYNNSNSWMWNVFYHIKTYE